MNNFYWEFLTLVYILLQLGNFLSVYVHWRPSIIRLNLVEPKQDFWEQVFCLRLDK